MRMMEGCDAAIQNANAVAANKPAIKRQRGRPPSAHLKGGRGVKRIRRSSLSGETTSSSSKPKPLNTYEIVAAILSKMTTSDPITISDLCGHIPNTSRESIHVVVDIMVILGFLMQVRLKDPPKSANSISSGRGGYHASRVHYALSGYMRSPTPIRSVANLTELVQEKLTSIEQITRRNKELQSMNFDFPARTPEEVKSTLTGFVLQTLEQAPELRNDALYIHIARLLNVQISSFGSKSDGSSSDCALGESVKVATE